VAVLLEMILVHKSRSVLNAVIHFVYLLLYLFQIVLTVAFYNHQGLAVLLGISWMILASGILLVLTSVRARKAAKNGELVTEGIYGMIRHLEYVGHMFIMISLILLSQFWLAVLTGSVLIVFLGLAVMEDERRNSEKFGERYKDYRERVPMVNIFVVIGRRFFRKRRGSCDK